MAETDNSAPEDYADVRPLVAKAGSGNLGLIVFAAILIAGGLWLFSALSANRAKLESPVTSFSGSETGAPISAAPPLRLSGADTAPVPLRPLELVRLGAAPPTSGPRARPAPTRLTPRAVAPPPQATFPEPPTRTPVSSVVFDSAFNRPPAAAQQAAVIATDGRVRADRFANPSFTISQGTVIPAVLETALDSTRPGAARALVQRDVYSFDGSRILIQRGSRIYGEYEAGLNPGEKRALIQWTRLIRPDGVTIALDSPSSDPLGRAGVKGDVDSKFLQRFGGAILQSVLDIGVGIATREASGDGVVVALPGSTQNIQVQNQQTVRPTLKIRHGTSVSIFVARDLDFSSVDS